MKIKRIDADNFLSFKKLKYTFDSSDINVIQGLNLDNSPASSNGSGKSSFLDCVCYGLYGKLPRKIKQEEVLNRDVKKNLLVSIDISISNKEYNIVRSRAHDQYGNDLVVIDNGKHIRGKNISETQSILEKLIEIDYDTFVNSFYFSCESDTSQILYATDSKRRVIFNKLTDLDWIDKTYKLLKAELKDAKATRNIALIQRQEIDAALSSSGISSLEEKTRLWEQEKVLKIIGLTEQKHKHRNNTLTAVQSTETKIKQLETSVSDIGHLLEKEDTNTKQIHSLEETVLNNTQILKQIDSYKKVAVPVEIKQEIIKQELVKLEQRILSVNDLSGTCDSCGSEIEEHKKESLVTSLNTNKIDLMKVMENNSSLLVINKECIDELGDEKTITQENISYTKQIREIKNNSKEKILSQSLQNNKLSLQRYLDKYHQLKKEVNPFDEKISDLKDMSNPYIEILEDTKNSFKELIDKKATIDEKLVIINNELNVLEVWSGWEKKLKASLISGTLTNVNFHIQDVLSYISNGNLSFSFEIEDEDSIVTNVVNAGHNCSFASLSLGEKAMVRQSVQIAFFKFKQETMSSQAPFLMFDEPFDGMDDTNRSKSLDKIVELLLLCDNIFLIDHSDTITSKIDSVIRITKEKGVSTIE